MLRRSDFQVSRRTVDRVARQFRPPDNPPRETPACRLRQRSFQKSVAGTPIPTRFRRSCGPTLHCVILGPDLERIQPLGANWRV